jgi:carbonic anhydrase
MKTVWRVGVACLMLMAAAVMPTVARSGSSEPTAPDRGATGAAATAGHQIAAKDAQAEAPAAGHGGAAWGYAGGTGPENWGRLSADYRACLEGAEQSPIDIGGTKGRFDGASVAPIDFDYRLSPVEFVNNGHTVQVNYAPGSGITVGGKRFELLQFHFHTPSEHALGGHRAALEAHLVHKAADGELAVIGVMVEEGPENLALSEFWTLMPARAGESNRERRVLINARDLLPHGTGYYRYMGSLTTPPCSEGVNWFVMAEPVTASARQIGQLAKVIGANARPVQPVGRRLVLAPLDGVKE